MTTPNPPTDRELDELLAEHVLGMIRPNTPAYKAACAREPRLKGYDGFWANPDLSAVTASVPGYTRDVGDAIDALGDYCDTHSLVWCLEGPTPDDAINAGYRCSIMRWRDEEGDERVGTADAPTLPRAIVLALLRSAGVEVGRD